MDRLDNLKTSFKGEIFDQPAFRFIYATDASEYREIPLGVAYPKNHEEIQQLIQFAQKHQISLIPRAGGTSLAGQVVGSGLVVDLSKYFNTISEVDIESQSVWVEAGVVRDDLNKKIHSMGLFFAPETSTSNRACIGGMLGNNSCGANSLIYGNTRAHVLEAKGFLSDGTFVHFKSIPENSFQDHTFDQNSLESKIYKSLFEWLKIAETQEEIKNYYPDPKITRRNCGYAVDELILSAPFQQSTKEQAAPEFNLCTLLAGSEGTLALITDVKVKLSPLPSPYQAVIAVHCDSVHEVLLGNLIALQHQPSAVELIDDQIIQLSLTNPSQQENISILQIDPLHPEINILAIEFTEKDSSTLISKCEQTILALKKEQIGYHHPILDHKTLSKIWQIRKAGLGIMSNWKGTAKPKSFVEDSVVLPEQLPSYFAEFEAICKEKGILFVSYGHIATGEIHKKPVLDFQNPEHYNLFRELALMDAHLVKKYKGSISGEHGDGRLRGEFIPLLLGEKNYHLLVQIKNLFDPNHILNPGKIVESPPMDQNLRETPAIQQAEIPSYFDFEETDGFVQAIKKCCNSGDCRKSALQGGTMCPSFQAQQEEYFSTRARANLLREMILNTSQDNPYRKYIQHIQKDTLSYSDKDIYEILSWCLACKACKTECPSQVDMTKLRAEFLQHYYDRHGIPFRSWVIGNYPIFNELGSFVSPLYNFVITNKTVSRWFKKIIGFASQRSLPTIHSTSLWSWHHKRMKTVPSTTKKVYLFPDEFTNRNDVEMGQKAILLLEKLGYQVLMVKSAFSGRTYLSKGLLKRATKCAIKNIQIYDPLINENAPLVGIEPSAILSFKDEYPDLVQGKLKEKAQQLSKNCLLIDEFIVQEFKKGNITSSQFTTVSKKIIFHTHCYQKVLSDKGISVQMMEIPQNYTVELIDDGCCGMAGSFGFEEEHFEISQKIGELKLFPAIRDRKEGTAIAACGTSCRHQIKDGTQEHSYHPIEILYDALIQ